MQQAVFVLNADEVRVSQTVRGRFGFAQLLRREIRAADRPHLPGAHELVERAKSLRDWYFGIGDVLLVEIDVVSAQPLQTRLECPSYVLGTRAFTLTGNLQPELCRDHHLRSPARQKPSDQLLAAAVGVGVSRVEQIDAVVYG